MELSKRGEVFAGSNMLFNDVGRVGINDIFLVFVSVGMSLVKERFTSFVLKLSSGVKTFFVEFNVINNSNFVSSDKS